MSANQHHEICVGKVDHLERNKVARESLFSFTKALHKVIVLASSVYKTNQIKIRISSTSENFDTHQTVRMTA